MTFMWIAGDCGTVGSPDADSELAFFGIEALGGG